MRITPLDIRNHAFPRRLGGYGGEEVDTFLSLIADDFEELLRESEAMRERLIRLEAQVEHLSSNETILQETLTTAQQMSEDLKRTAVKEAEVLLGEAEIKAEKVLDAAHRRAVKLSGDLREMKLLRTRLAASIRGTIDTHLGMLDALAQDPAEATGLADSPALLIRGRTEPSEPVPGA